MVTFSTSSFTANSLGGGRKSSTIFTAPMGPLLYLIGLLIDALTLSPVACTEDPNHAIPVGKSHGQDAAAMTAEAVVTRFLFRTVRQVFGQDAAPIKERSDSLQEADAVLILIRAIFTRIPLEG